MIKGLESLRKRGRENYKGILAPRFVVFRIKKRWSGPGLKGPVYEVAFRNVKTESQADQLAHGIRAAGHAYVLDEISFAGLRGGKEGLQAAKERVIKRNFPECLN